jgi:hypothetical protein
VHVVYMLIIFYLKFSQEQCLIFVSLSFCDIINAEVSQMSSRLSSESRIFADKAKDLNRQVTSVQTFLVAFPLRGSIIPGLALICALAFSIS